MFSFRSATLEDLSAIMSIIAQARSAIARLGIDQWQDGYPQAELIRQDIALHRAILMEVEAQPAGYMVPLMEAEPVYACIDGQWLSDAPYLTVHRMAVGDGHRGRGLGAQMLSFAENCAREHGLSSVRVDTHRGNRAMRALLTKCGYQLCGEVTYETQGDPIRVAYEKKV